jgi:predicted DNA-binding WGR domain protein
MTTITLHRIDATRNMSRFYRLDVQRDLFGAWAVIREWGRIGQPGRMRSDPYPTAEQAEDRIRPVRLSGTENRHKATYGSMTR